jgi:HEAT repeat protein
MDDPFRSLTSVQRQLIEEALRFDSFDQRFQALDKLETELSSGEDWAALAGALLSDIDNESNQQLGLDMLGMLATRDSTWIPELVSHVKRLARSNNEDTRWSAAHAVSGLCYPDVLDLLLSLANDTDSDVRWQVTIGLPKVLVDYPSERGVDALLKLMEDPDPEIRDWAAFGIGSQLNVDSDKIRDALAAHIDEEQEQTSGEALLGLARRGDDRALGPILNSLESGDPGNLIVDAAGKLGDPRLLPALTALKKRGWTDENTPTVLDDAIRSCTPKRDA